jgi:hypothetical protein
MNGPIIRDKVLEEIQLIPEDKIEELYHMIHDFRLGLETSDEKVNRTMQFAGSWNDMPVETFSQFSEELAQRRRHAFARRRGRETSLD